MSPSEFSLTRHAIKRLLERFPEFGNKWSGITQPVERLKLAYDLLLHSKEEKRVFNDLCFMLYIYDKYGYGNRYTFFVLADAVFVGTSNERGNNVVTVLRKSIHSSEHLRYA